MWILCGLAAWLLVASVAGVVLGRGIRIADRRDRSRVLPTADLPNVIAAG